MTYIKDIESFEGKEISLQGWVAKRRSSKHIVFIEFRDGTGFCQLVMEREKLGDNLFIQADKLTLESAIAITGVVKKDEKQLGGYEVNVSKLDIMSIAEEYPITKKDHGVDFLMDHRHLWLRSQRQWAIMRVRNCIIYAIHNYFQSEGFTLMDAPLFTANAAEGTTNLFETDFYGEPAYLSQSGQLYGEAMALALNKIYTFGPTFRAEKSKTRRHLSEFWMIEPEMAFYDLDMNMDTIESMMKAVIKEVLAKCREELTLLERPLDILEKTVSTPFKRITYDEAVRILKGEQDVNGMNSIKTLENDLAELNAQIAAIKKDIADREARIESGALKGGEVNFNRTKIDQLGNDIKELQERSENIPLWINSARNFEDGNDFGGSDETVITRLFDTPIMVYRWPKAIKAFYMKTDPDNPAYVRGVDVLAPEGFGEIVGGGERETDLKYLIDQIHHHNLPMSAFEWYLDLRRYGNVKHSGFGLGLERLVAWICKLPHVRETIPFPRMYGRLKP